MNLLDDGAESGGLSLKINKDFAAKYDAKKRGEELSKLKDKYGEDALNGEDGESESSTDYSSEDSEAEFVTPEVDAAILNIIGKIRQRDSALYAANGRDFFDEEEKRLASKAKSSKKDAKKSSSSKKEKTVKLKDYQRNALLAGVHTQDSDDEANAAGPSFRTPAQEAEDLRSETKNAFLLGDSDGDDEDDLLVRRDEQDASDDEDQYKRFLLENVGKEEMERALAIRRENEASEAAANSNGAAGDDEFLKNYILNRGWLDKKSKHIPRYSEIVPGDEDDEDEPAPGPGPSGANATSLNAEESDEEFERAEEFETKYNFRFEEAAGGEIQTHGRDAGASLRRVDDSRKKAREQAAARKAEQKQERMEELKRLKNLKKQEIMDKIAKIKEVAGVDGVDFSGLDLDEEYDPSSHAAKMARVFNENFYGEDDANEKPVWDDDIDITDIVPDDKHDEAYAPGGEAYDPTEAGPSGKKSRAERKKEKKAKKKDKGKQRAVDEEEEGADEADEQPVLDFDASEFDNIADPEERKRKIDAFMEEYYAMDYEDVIGGDLPTRFHYTSSALNPAGSSADPSGLTAMEILMATDAELNEFESLRKLAPYRGAGKDGGGNKKRKKLKELRKRLAQRRWGEDLPDPEDEAFRAAREHKQKRKADALENGNAEPAGPPKKRKGKKERQKQQAAAGTKDDDAE